MAEPSTTNNNRPDLLARVLLGLITVFVGWGLANTSRMTDTVALLSEKAAAREVRLDALAEQVRDLKASQVALGSDMRAEQARLSKEWRADSAEMSARLQEILVELARLAPRQEVFKSEGK